MKKIITSALFGSLIVLASNAYAIDPPKFNTPNIVEESKEVVNTTVSKESVPQAASGDGFMAKKPKISDAVKAELRDYKAKKKELYNSLSDDAKKVLSKHNKKRPLSYKRNKKTISSETSTKDVMKNTSNIAPIKESNQGELTIVTQPAKK